MKSRNVVEKEQCIFKYRYGVLDSEKGKAYYNGVIIKDVFSKYGLSFTGQNIIDSIQSIMPGNCFHTNRENQINMGLLVERLLRFETYAKQEMLSNTTQVYGPKAINIIHNITVDYSLILKDGDAIRIYKVKNKKNTKLKASGRSIFTRVSDSMELYLLQLAGEKLYPNAHVEPGIVFLAHPDDKSDQMVDASNFNSKKNGTLVSYHFKQSDRAKMDERIEDIMNDTIKTCEGKCNECIYDSICNYIDNTMSLNIIPTKPKTLGMVKFTKEQEKVIQIEKGTYRVLAGAGSGKTTCIANRIAKLVEHGYHLNDILLITFTTKGVEEMREKIEYWLGMYHIPYNKKDLNIFTFNSFGYELIKKEYKSLGFTKVPSLFEKSESLNYIKELLDSHDEIKRYNYANPFLDMRYAKGAVYQAAEDFETLKKEGVVYPDEVAGILDIDDNMAQDILTLYQCYNRYMKQNNLIDYNDQVQLAYDILSKPNNVKKYGFVHILCDEFQDSDNLQINILEKLASYKFNESIMVVGDDSQAIFSWRGATSENILNFHKYFKNSVDIELVENFRSTDEICQLANRINDINKNKVEKSLVGVSHGTMPILKNGNLTNLVETVINDIKTKKLSYSDIAIIARNKSSLLQARNMLLEKNIPCILSVSEFLIDNQAVNHIADFFKFLNDYSLDLYFAEYLQVKEYEKFQKEKNSALFYKYLDDEKAKFLDVYDPIKEEEKLTFILEKLDEIGDKNEAIKSLSKVLKDKEFETVAEASTFLQNMILYKSENMVDVNDKTVDAITLTTAHSSKGKEWENVYIELDKFKYPAYQDYYKMRNEPIVEEERRLLFVAITRAKKNLTMFGHGSIFEEIAEGLGINKGQQNIV